VAGDHEKALQLANEAIKADSKEPWGHYTRGDALGSLHRVDDAVEAFRQAEQRFSPADSWGRSVAIWAQANAFMQVGRFQEASATFERCIAFSGEGRQRCGDARPQVRGVLHIGLEAPLIPETPNTSTIKLRIG
jgi:tetratricopeptide (TPR) repeat protein